MKTLIKFKVKSNEKNPAGKGLTYKNSLLPSDDVHKNCMESMRTAIKIIYWAVKSLSLIFMSIRFLDRFYSSVMLLILN